MDCFACTMVSVNRISDSHALAGKSYGKRVTAHHELDFITGGEGWMLTGDHRESTRPGRLFYRPPGTVVEGIAPYSCYFFQFNTDAQIDLPACTIDFTEPAGMQTLFERAYIAFLRQDAAFEYLFQVTVNEIILQILLQRSKPMPPDSEPEAIHRAMEYLREHYRDPLTLEEVSRRFGYSKYWFAHAFQAAHGVSPMAYLRSVRLTAARRLLLETSLPVQEIRMRCGYMDEAAFFRAFRRFTGLSPGAFRTQYGRIQPGTGERLEERFGQGKERRDENGTNG